MTNYTGDTTILGTDRTPVRPSGKLSSDTTCLAFVYGTLRIGGALDGLMPGDYLGTAVTGGFMYRHHSARFPVLVQPGDPAKLPMVTGDLYRVPALDFGPVMDMELGAGYDGADVSVTLLSSTLGTFRQDASERPTQHRAVAFLWPTDKPVGPRIFGGNWLSQEAEKVCAELRAGAGFERKDSR